MKKKGKERERKKKGREKKGKKRERKEEGSGHREGGGPSGGSG